MSTSWSSLFVQWYITYIRRSKPTYSSSAKTRALLAELYLHPQSYNPPPLKQLGPGVVVERADVSEWPLYRISPSPSPLPSPPPPPPSSTTAKPRDHDNDSPPRDAMLYVHGGAWIHEAAPPHWTFAAQVARETGLDVLLPVYPLLPRPTATARHVVDGLAGIVGGVAAAGRQRVVSIAGDSAGGCLALATMQHLIKAESHLAADVASLVLISPVLDCALDHPELIALDENDPWLGIQGLRELIPHYTGGGELRVSDPVVSPLFGDIDDLPPTLLLCGTHDILCSDARRLSARFQGQSSDKGVPGSLETKNFTFVEQPNMIHVYPLLPHWEGRQAKEMILAFVSKHIEHPSSS